MTAAGQMTTDVGYVMPSAPISHDSFAMVIVSEIEKFIKDEKSFSRKLLI